MGKFWCYNSRKYVPTRLSWSQPTNGAKRFIYVVDGKTAKVEAIRTFRLLLKTRVYLDLKETYVVPSFRQNLISIFVLDKSRYYCSFGNLKLVFL